MIAHLIDVLLAIGVSTVALSGLLICYGLLNVINLAHGDLVAIGAYTAALCSDRGVDGLICCVSAIFVCAVVGLVLEILVIRFCYGREVGLSLLTTWGISLAIVQILRLVFGPTGRFASVPISGVFSLGGATYPLYRVSVLGVCILVLATMFVARRSRFGIQVRASIEQPCLANAFGVNTRSVFRTTFLLSAAVAGLSGALIAPMVAVYPSMGADYTTLGFLAVLLTRRTKLGWALAACGLLSAIRSSLEIAVDATTATLLMYTVALLFLLGNRSWSNVPAADVTIAWKE